MSLIVDTPRLPSPALKCHYNRLQHYLGRTLLTRDKQRRKSLDIISEHYLSTIYILHIYILARTMRSAEVSDAARCRCPPLPLIHHPPEAATCRLAASCFRPATKREYKASSCRHRVSSVTCENSIWNNKNNNCVFNIPTQMSNVSPPRPLLRNRKLGHVSGPRARVSTASEGVWCRHNCGQRRSLLLCAELCHTDPELMYGDATAIFLFGFWLFKVTRGFNVQANRVAHACRVDPLKVRGGSPLRVLWSCLGWWLAVFVSLTHYCGILWPDSCRPAQPPNCPVTAHKRGQHTALILQHSSHFLRWSAFVFVVL